MHQMRDIQEIIRLGLIQSPLISMEHNLIQMVLRIQNWEQSLKTSLSHGDLKVAQNADLAGNLVMAIVITELPSTLSLI